MTVARSTVAALLLLALAGCAADEPAREPGDAATSARAANASLYTSERYAYRVEVPLGFFVQATPGPWKGALAPGDPGVDTFTNADATIRVFAAARPLGRGVKRDEWTRRMRDGVPDLCSLTKTSRRTVGGEPADVGSYSCSDGYQLLLATTVHGRRGFAIASASREGAEAEGARIFRTLLGSFRFVA